MSSPQLPAEDLSCTGSAMLVPGALRLRVRTRIAQLLQQGCAGLGLPRVPAVTCSFDLRGTKAGQAVTVRRGTALVSLTVRLNAALLVANEATFMQNVIPHEVAHLLVELRHGPNCKPHGPHWQSVMHLLGARATRTHTMNVSVARKVPAKFRYRCACREVMLTSIRHQRIQRGANYHCRLCGSPLQPAAVASNPAAISAPRVALPQSQRRPLSTPVAAGGPAAAPERAACPLVLAPTQRQLDYAQVLAVRRHLVIPPQVRFDRRLLSEWISQHA